MNIVELLKIRGLDIGGKIKMLRHQKQGYDLHEIYRHNREHFEIYQSAQGKTRLNCGHLVSFIGLPFGHAVFVGVYRVEGSRPIREIEGLNNYPYLELIRGATTWYDLARCDGYDDLTDRIIIDWGKSERSWHQWLNPGKPKEVVEILPTGHIRHFPGFLELALDFNELRTMIRNPIANREWHILLKSVAGVYLILDKKTGDQYVGAAYGMDGILGRWRTYAETGHGGNKLLKGIMEADAGYAGNFRFSILHTLPISCTIDEALEWERLFKNKLGTRAFGLNAN